jgi:hypothetical protein
MYLDLREVSDTQNAHTHSTDGVNVKQQSRISNWISQTGFSDWPFQSTTVMDLGPTGWPSLGSSVNETIM